MFSILNQLSSKVIFLLILLASSSAQAYKCNNMFSVARFLVEGRFITFEAMDIQVDNTYGQVGVFRARLIHPKHGLMEMAAMFKTAELEKEFMDLRYSKTDKTFRTFVSGKLELFERLDMDSGTEFIAVFDRIREKQEPLEMEESVSNIIPFYKRD